MGTRLNTKEKQRIINLTARAMKEGQKAAHALEDAIDKVAPRAMKEDADKNLYLDLTETVQKDLIEQAERKNKAANKQVSGKCLCGCGGTTGKNSRFLQGHDARLVKHMAEVVLKIRDISTIPAAAIEFLQSPEGATLKAKIAVQAQNAKNRQVAQEQARVQKAQARVEAAAKKAAAALERAQQARKVTQ